MMAKAFGSMVCINKRVHGFRGFGGCFRDCGVRFRV